MADIEKTINEIESWLNATDGIETEIELLQNPPPFFAIANALKLLKEQQPKKGHWIDNDDPDDNYFTCSVCGDLWILNDGTPEDNLMNYCPHCGARMDERREGEQE